MKAPSETQFPLHTPHSAPLKVLLIEDNPGDARLIQVMLKEGRGVRFELDCTDRLAAGLERLAAGGIDVVLLDLWLPDSQGRDTFARAQAVAPGVPIVVLTGLDDESLGEELVRAGAQDYFVKGEVTDPILGRAIRYAIDRQHSETALRQSEERFHAVVHSAAEAIISTDADGAILDWNPYAEAIFGYSKPEAIGQPLTLIIPERFREAHRQGLERFKPNGESKGIGKIVELVGLRKDGSEFPLQLALSSWKADEGTCFCGMIRDITEQKRAEEALRASEEYARSIIDSSLDMIISTDLARRITRFNKAAEATFGYRAEEVLGQHVDLLYADLQQSQSVHFTVVQKGQCVQEILNRRKNGQVFPSFLASAVLRDKHGEVVGFMGISRDITDHVATVKALQANLQQLQDAHQRLKFHVNRMPLAYIAWDHEFRVTEWNPAAARIFGWSAQEALGRHAYELIVPPDVQPLVNRLWVDLLSGGERSEHSVNENTRKDGSRLICEWFNTPLRDATGQIMGGLSMAYDITERKRAEEQIQKQAVLINITQDAMIVRDMGRRILFWNKAAERLYGWTADEALGRTTHELLYEPEGLAQLEKIPSILEEKGEWRGELNQISRGKRKITVEARLTLMRDAEGKPDSVLVVATDITEKKLLEKQFLRAQRLESIGSLASGVAHDLNNILAPILMAEQILRTKCADADAQKMLELVGRSAQRGADIVKQLLTFARGLEGKRVLLQPRHLIKEMAQIARATFPKFIRTETRVAQDLWAVTGDATQLQQVLMNLFCPRTKTPVAQPWRRKSPPGPLAKAS